MQSLRLDDSAHVGVIKQIHLKRKLINMATFFGEVTELSSRAVWWSDSEDEELSSGNNNSPAKSVKDYSFHLDVKNAVSLDEFKNEYSRLFVSVVKSDRHFKNLNACVKLQLKASKDGQDGKFSSS